MSLDCYPFGKRRSIGLGEQPMALDVAYDDNLFISVTDQCQSIVVYDLLAPDDSNLIRKFSIGRGIVLDQIKYCRTGDYLACVGHKQGTLSVYIVLDWRQTASSPEIFELDVKVELDDHESSWNNLNSIDCCQKTGNLAASLGDRVTIYHYIQNDNNNNNPTAEFAASKNGSTLKVDTIEDLIESNTNNNQTSGGDGSCGNKKQHFEHIISLRLTIWALKINLLENYLSIMAVDHVQVLKLELLTLQIQSDVLDVELADQLQDIYNGQAHNSGSDPSNYTEGHSETTSTSTTMGTTCSMISESIATDVSSTNNNNNTGEQQLNNSDLSIITMNHRNNNDFCLRSGDDLDQSADDCITWNLNTKKLVKLPTLMHNTSKNLSSYHICHPLELLGPASESIACRVSGSIYSAEFCQNQLEPVVMLCKQFDFERDPVKSTYLQAVYLSSYEDKRRLSKQSNQQQQQQQQQATAAGLGSRISEPSASFVKEPTTLMESAHYELLASVTCFVTTLTTCFIYAIHGEEVTRTQTITYPDLCLDLRPDLLNAYLLTPMGLQICSTGACDLTFRYDWSSSADLNLSFIATNLTRVLTSSDYVILVACSVNGHCEVKFMNKPSLSSLYDRIVHTVNRCNSISIRSNLLTYLHAMSQLALLDARRESPLDDATDETLAILRTATVMLCKQLLQKKQTNVITNSRIDKNVKHLLDISFCDLVELMRRHMEESTNQQDGGPKSSASLHSLDNDSSCELMTFRSMLRLSRAAHIEHPSDKDDNYPLGINYELIKIYLKLAKFNQSILDYLISNLANEIVGKTIIDYMFEHNPRLLIKCAQRIPMRLNTTPADDGDRVDRKQAHGVMLVVDKLRLLAEFFSTGIDRATVLFTLATLYNALDELQNCLSALSQIKPSNHLVIIMSHNCELSHSIASVVQEHYPDVFSLFMGSVKRKKSWPQCSYIENSPLASRLS